MRRTIALFGGVAVALPLLIAVAQATEVALDKVPKPVMEAAQARFAEAKATAAGKEKTPEGNLVYEISMEDKDLNNVDLTLTPEGTILLIEKQVGRKDLPESIAKVLEVKYPKAKYRFVEAVIEIVEKEEQLTSYEVILLTPKKQTWALQLALDGKIMKEENQTGMEED